MIGSLAIILFLIVALHAAWLVALVASLRAAPPRRPSTYRSRAEWLAARRRAEALLRAKLTPAEQAQLLEDDYLRVMSPTMPGRSYHIPRYGDMVEVYEAGRVIMRLCIQPPMRLPEADVLLAHKLAIEGDEATYLRTANQFPVTRWL